MMRVNSSQIHSVGYDAPTNTLRVKFHAKGCVAKNITCECGGGPVYSYPGVSAEKHSEFVTAESIGKYFGQHFRKLPFTKESEAK